MRSRAKKPVNSLITWRFMLVCSVVLLVFVTLMSRAAYLQVIEPDKARSESNKRTVRVEKLHVQRGMIFDRHGKELAVSVPVVSVYADPKALHKSLVAKVLRQARRNGEDHTALSENKTALNQRVALYYKNDLRWRELADVLRIEPKKINSRLRDDASRRFVYLKRQVTPAVANYIGDLRLPGIHLLDESKRYYPAGEVTAHVLGFTNIDGKGIEGIEKLYENALTGEEGRRTIRKDGQGREVEVLDERERVEPENIQLSIDQRIQAIAYKAVKSAVLTYKATSGSAMVVDVKTGEVLAMVNSPSFNPNNLTDAAPHKRRNRAITDLFEPGSTVKPLAILAGLDYGTIQPDDTVDTYPGWMRLGGSLVQDTRNHGDMTLRDILKYSSNMGVTKISQTVPKDYFVGLYQKVGFGSDSGTGMVGESSGLFYPDRRWSDHEIAALSFGYNLAVSTAQMARFYAAGKTGTSKKAAVGGYGDEYVGYFAGLAPASNPRLAVVVLINEPGGDVYYGGATAGPAFAEIISNSLRILNVAPDKGSVAYVKGKNDGA